MGYGENSEVKKRARSVAVFAFLAVLAIAAVTLAVIALGRPYK